jgi:hypothetical protein
MWVEFSGPHHLGKFKAIIRKELSRRGLAGDAIVSVGKMELIAA